MCGPAHVPSRALAEMCCRPFFATQLPFVIETPSMIRHKAGLEDRLREIAEAERIFGRPGVLVRDFSR